MYISEISGIFFGYIQCVRTNFIIAVTCRLVDSLTCRLVDSKALGIGAASFASAVYGASKDIAESPTAIAGTPTLIYN